MSKISKLKEKNIAIRIKKLKEKGRENKLIVTKADKGNIMVIMEKKEYLNKADKFIKKGLYKEVKYK